MPLFGAIGLAGTGLTVHRKWLDAISDNLSNMNDVTSPDKPAFQARFITAAPMQGGGTEVTGVLLGSAQGQLSYDPGSPLADAQGMVRRPDIDLSGQMTQMIMAQRGYEANIAMIKAAQQAYQQALQLGR